MILTGLTKYRDWGLLFLRVALGTFYFWVHGWRKLAGGVHEWHEIGLAMHYVGIHFMPVFWGLMAALSETLGCVLWCLGFVSACVHSAFHHVVCGVDDVEARGVERGIAAGGAGDFVFLSLIFIGPGKYSVDKS